MKKWSYIIILFLLFGCEKENRLDCFKSTGDTVSEERYLGDFTILDVDDKINFYIDFGTENKARIECGENLVSSIKTEVKDGRLIIRNENKCNWVRSFKHEINVYLTLKDLETIDYRGTGELRFNNFLMRDTFTINTLEGGGSVYLKLLTKVANIKSGPAAVDINVEGRSLVGYFYNPGQAPFNCLDFQVNLLYIISKGTNDCYVNVFNGIDAQIEYSGNIYYTGDPLWAIQNGNGTGKLIKL
jgi:hypothetical protein